MTESVKDRMESASGIAVFLPQAPSQSVGDQQHVRDRITALISIINKNLREQTGEGRDDRVLPT
jgi:hypothetical protein